MRAITEQTEEQFREDRSLVRWWREISSSEQFDKVLDAAVRNIPSEERVCDRHGIDAAWGYRNALDNFIHSLKNVCKPEEREQESQTQFKLQQDPELER